MLDDLRRSFAAGDFGRVISHAVRLLSESPEAAPAERAEAARLGLLAAVHSAKGQWDLQRALWFAGELRDALSLSADSGCHIADYYLGCVHCRLGHWAEATVALTRFVASSSDSLHLADAWFNLAKARVGQRDTLAALHAYARAAELYLAEADSEAAVRSLANAAWAAAEAGLGSLAQDYLRQAQQHLDRCTDPRVGWTFSTSAALVAYSVGQLEDAAGHARGIVAAAVEHGEEARHEKPGRVPVPALRVAEALWILGGCELRAGNRKEALRLARAALDRAIASGYPPMMYRANQLLCEVSGSQSA